MLTKTANDLSALGRIWLVLMVVIAGAATALAQAPAPGAANRPHPRLGTNLEGPADWNSELPFVDIFHLSRPWISQKQGAGWGNGPALKLDEHGWVKALEPDCWAETLMCTGLQNHYPAGRYTVLYEGKGQITFDGSGTCKVVDAKPGRILIDVDPSHGGMFLQIRRSDPANYIRNIRVIMPGFEATYAQQPFTPQFLKRWQGVGCFRFITWMKTDNGKVQIKTWADRPQTGDATYTAKGVPLKVMIDLCNRQKADPWFCMPVQADDDYIRQFAGQVKAQLDPSLKVYIEYSNECWNGIFAQQHYVQQMGQKLKLGNPDRPWEGGCLYYARRAVEIFRIWQDVFGGTDRLVRVLSWQAASSSYWLNGMLLSHVPPGQVDALAIAPYMMLIVPEHSKRPGALTAETVSEWTVPQVLDYVANKALPQSRQWVQRAAGIAAKYHLKLVAYEAGQHLVGVAGGQNNDTLTHLFEAANADPRMGEIYSQYLAMWRDEGGDLLNNFSSVGKWSKWGSWGLLQYADEDPAKSPKFMAVMRWAKSLSQPVNLPVENAGGGK